MKAHGVLRGLFDPDDDLLVWDAHAATHGDVILAYKHRTGAYGFLIRPDGVAINDLQIMDNDGDGPEEYPYRQVVRHLYNEIINHPTFKRFYGNNFRVVGIDNDVDQEIAITPQWIEKNVVPI